MMMKAYRIDIYVCWINAFLYWVLAYSNIVV